MQSQQIYKLQQLFVIMNGRVLVFVYCFFAFATMGQDAIDNLDRDLFQSDRLIGYENLTFKWTLSGQKQVLLNEGINYLAEKDPQIALQNLNDFIKLDSGFWVAFYYRGVCLKQLGRFRKAQQNLLAAVKLNPTSYEANIELGKVYHLLGFSDREAEKQYKKATTIKANDAIPLYLLGDLAFRAGNRRQAIRHYKESLAVDPNFSDAKIKLGLLDVVKTQDGADLLPYLNQVLSTDTLNRTALSLRSMLLAKDNPERAIADFSKLIKLNPANVRYRLFRGILYAEGQDFDNAFNDLNRVIQATPEDENRFVGKQTDIDKRIDIVYAGTYVISTIYGLPSEEGYKVKKAFCLILIGNHWTAVHTLESVVGHTKSALCWFLKALAFEHGGDHVKAFQCYYQALRFDNDITDAHKKRAIYLTEYKKWQEAEKDFDEVLRLNPSQYVAYKLRGVTKFYQGNFKGAESDFSTYLQSDTTNIEALESRGMARYKQGKLLESIGDFLRSRNFQMIKQNEMKGAIEELLAKQDTAKAMAYLEDYITITPNFVDARCMKIKILISQNRWDVIGGEVESALKCTANMQTIKDVYSFLLVTRGRLHSRMGATEEAIESLSEAIDADKTNSDAFLYRGMEHQKMDKQKAALKDFQTAAKLGNAIAKKIIDEK